MHNCCGKPGLRPGTCGPGAAGPDPTTPNPDSTGTPTPEIVCLTEREENHENAYEDPATIDNEPYPRTLRLSLGNVESRDVTLDVRGTSLLHLHGVFLEGEDDCHVGDAAWGDARVDE